MKEIILNQELFHVCLVDLYKKNPHDYEKLETRAKFNEFHAELVKMQKVFKPNTDIPGEFKPFFEKPSSTCSYNSNLYFLYHSYKCFLHFAQFESISSYITYKRLIRDCLTSLTKAYKLEKLVTPFACSSCFYDTCVFLVMRIQHQVARFCTFLLDKTVIDVNIPLIEWLATCFDITEEEHILLGKFETPHKVKRNGKNYVIRNGIFTPAYIHYLEQEGVIPDSGKDENYPFKKQLCKTKFIKDYFHTLKIVRFVEQD